MIFNDEELAKDNEIHIDEEEINDNDKDSADELDELENQLDDMYHQYQARKAERDANYRAKQARGDADDDEAWNGIEEEEEEDNDDVESGKDYEMESESDDDDDEHIRLIAEKKSNGSLSRTARNFFASDSIFNELSDDVILEEIENKTKGSNGKMVESIQEQVANDNNENDDGDNDDNDEEESDFEIVPNQKSDDDDESMDSDDDEVSTTTKSTTHQQKVDLATVEAMTLAHQVALGQKNKYDLIDEGINRYSFRDKDNLPDWFIDDEKKHSKLIKPITKEAAIAIKEKQKQLNARPIKKVLEAQGRKKLRALKRLEKIKKKSDLINEDSGKSERDKADEISKLMKKLNKKQKQKPKTTVVVARGSNRGLSGRPKGVKGKYKMVDGVMKNEQRALKRIAKKYKK